MKQTEFETAFAAFSHAQQSYIGRWAQRIARLLTLEERRKSLDLVEREYLDCVKHMTAKVFKERQAMDKALNRTGGHGRTRDE